MEKSSKRGKIPQTDWPLIVARYEAGETLASIARTYDCSPPAISYVVSRNREQAANDASSAAAAEPQLIKAPGGGSAASGASANEPLVVPPPPAPAVEIRREPTPEIRPAATNGDHRPKLHLSLGNANGHGNGHGPTTNGNGHSAPTDRPPLPNFAAPRTPQPLPQGLGERSSQPAFQAPSRNPLPFGSARMDRDLVMPEAKPAFPQSRNAEAPRKDAGAFIDQELRTRVDGDIAAFLAAFDAALAEDTQASRFGLREATDRLLRAGARTRIELERLEARVPLARDPAADADPGAWRYR
jgi:hypothetical protein